MKDRIYILWTNSFVWMCILLNTSIHFTPMCTLLLYSNLTRCEFMTGELVRILNFLFLFEVMTPPCPYPETMFLFVAALAVLELAL